VTNFFSLLSFAHSHRRLVSLIIGIGTLSVAAVAVAAIVSGNSTTGASSHVTYTQLTLPVPTVSAGDVMIASVAVKGATAAVMVTVPSGWAQIARADNDTNVSLISYWKVASASDASGGVSYTWTIQDQTRAEGGITGYSGVDTSNPIDTSSTSTGRGKIATTTAATTGSPNEEVITLFATDVGTTSSNGYFSAPTTTSMTQKYNASNAALGPSVAAFDKLQSATGTTGTISSGTGDNKTRDWAAQEIVLRPVRIITFDNTANTAVTGNATGTLPFETEGTNRMLIVSVTGEDTTDASSVTYNGVALTRAAVNHTTQAVSVWYLINPPAGLHDIVVNYAVPKYFMIMATSLDGVDQTTGIGATGVDTDGTNSETTSSVIVTTTHANSWIVDATRINGIRDVAPTGSNQTIRNTVPITVPAHFGQGEQSTESTGAIGNYNIGYSWTSGVDYYAAAVEVLPAN
jgi:hypothetical protein